MDEPDDPVRQTRPLHPVRVAGPTDAESIGHLLHAFNREFEKPTPSPAELADRMKWYAQVGRHWHLDRPDPR